MSERYQVKNVGAGYWIERDGVELRPNEILFLLNKLERVQGERDDLLTLLAGWLESWDVDTEPVDPPFTETRKKLSQISRKDPETPHRD